MATTTKATATAAVEQTDLYEILGVDQHATQEEIKRNYNELVLLYHPIKEVIQKNSRIYKLLIRFCQMRKIEKFILNR